MEVKVQRDTKVIISLDEIEAGKIMKVLITRVDFMKESWAKELYDSLVANDVDEQTYGEFDE